MGKAARWMAIVAVGLAPVPGWAGEAERLQDFALARCVARAYAAKEVREDAGAVAGAYVEQGGSDMEAYAAIDRLVQAQLEKDYPSKSGAKLQLMKCIDLQRSKALEEMIREFTSLKTG